MGGPKEQGGLEELVASKGEAGAEGGRELREEEAGEGPGTEPAVATAEGNGLDARAMGEECLWLVSEDLEPGLRPEVMEAFEGDLEHGHITEIRAVLGAREDEDPRDLRWIPDGLGHVAGGRSGWQQGGVKAESVGKPGPHGALETGGKGHLGQGGLVAVGRSACAGGWGCLKALAPGRDCRPWNCACNEF